MPHLSNIGASASESIVRLAEMYANKNLNMETNLQALRTILDSLDYNLYYQNKVSVADNSRIIITWSSPSTKCPNSGKRSRRSRSRSLTKLSLPPSSSNKGAPLKHWRSLRLRETIQKCQKKKR